MRRAVFIAILPLFLAGTLAWGEEEKPKPPEGASGESKKTKIVYKQSESHRFSGAQLKGKLKKPELSYIYERKGVKEERIVDIPEHFNNEIINGAGQL